MSAETPAEAARRHLSQGRQPVPVERKDKRPSGGDAWQHRRFSEADNLDAFFPVDGNIGLMVGAASGGLVDIDLDCDEAVSLGRVFLPPTGMIHGRPSRPMSHYWYIVDELSDVQQFRAPRSSGGKMLIEYRCSKGDRGYQTVIPPSVNKEGEQLAWLDPSGAPAKVSSQELLAAVRIVAAGSLLARSFPKQGQRHDFALALAGVLLRNGTPEDLAYEFVLEVCRAGGSTSPGERAKVVRTTARRLEAGDRDVTGIPRLMEIAGQDTIKRVLEWLDFKDSADPIRQAAAKLMSPEDSAKAAPSASAGLFGVGNTSEAPVDLASFLAASSEDPDGGDLDGPIKMDKNGRTIACGHNVYKILQTAASTAGHFRWDEVDKKLVVTGPFSSYDPSVLDVVIADWFMGRYDMNVDKGLVADRLMRIAMQNRFDPIRDYLRGIKWDGTPRLDTWLQAYAGAVASPEYLSFVGKKWMVSTVARALDPGVKADLVLILEGNQGTGKSSLFEMLGGKWYVDLTISLHDKDAKMLNSGAWISELPDLAALKKTSEINAVKAFFSTRVDKFRPPYGRTVITAPRRTVYGASTNDLTYLSDITGNRRFCCVRTGAIDRVALMRDRDQLFAEAVALYDKHLEECESKTECGCWWPTKEEAVMVEDEASQRVEDPATVEIISAWWSSLPPDQRPRKLLTSKVAKDALKCDDDRISRGMQMDVGHAMKRLGFQRVHGRVDGQAKPCWHYEPTEKLLNLPMVDFNYTTRKYGGAAKSQQGPN